MIIKAEQLYRRVVEEDYTPSADELFWYYSGTHGGLNPNNPYRLKGSRKITTKYVKVNHPYLEGEK